MTPTTPPPFQKLRPFCPRAFIPLPPFIPPRDLLFGGWGEGGGGLTCQECQVMGVDSRIELYNRFRPNHGKDQILKEKGGGGGGDLKFNGWRKKISPYSLRIIKDCMKNCIIPFMLQWVEMCHDVYCTVRIYTFTVKLLSLHFQENTNDFKFKFLFRNLSIELLHI